MKKINIILGYLGIIVGVIALAVAIIKLGNAETELAAIKYGFAGVIAALVLGYSITRSLTK